MSLDDIRRRTAACERIDRADIERFLASDDRGERYLAHRCLAVQGLLEAVDHLSEGMSENGHADVEDLQRLFAVCRLAEDTETIVRSGFLGGLAAVRRGDDALALEILQVAAMDDIRRGIKYLGNTTGADEVAKAYDTVAARHVPFAPVTTAPNTPGRLRVGYVVPNLIDDVNAPSQRILNFAKYHDRERFQMHVYSSEGLCRRARPLYFRSQQCAGTAERAPKMLRTFTDLDIPFYAAPVDGTLIDSAEALARRMREDRLDVAAYQSSLACPIECLVADWHVAPVQVNVNIGVPMYVQGIDCTTYFMRGNHDREAGHFASRGKRTLFVHGGIDLDVSLPPLPRRAECGIPESAVILMTVGNNLPQRLSPEFVDCVSRILLANRDAIYVVIGGGDLTTQKERFHEAGVLKRVAFTGPRNDVRHVIRLADVYVNEFPQGGAQSVMEAMAAGVPAVAMRYSDQHLHCCGAEYVGDEMTIRSRDFDGYVRLVGRLITDAAFRRERARAARRRVEELYSFRNCVRRFESLYLELSGEPAADAA